MNMRSPDFAENVMGELSNVHLQFPGDVKVSGQPVTKGFDLKWLEPNHANTYKSVAGILEHEYNRGLSGGEACLLHDLVMTGEREGTYNEERVIAEFKIKTDFKAGLQ